MPSGGTDIWWVVNHPEISNYPYCLRIGSHALSTCRATHTSPLLNLPRLNSSRRLAATGLPSRPQPSRAPSRVALLLPVTKVALAQGSLPAHCPAPSRGDTIARGPIVPRAADGATERLARRFTKMTGRAAWTLGSWNHRAREASPDRRARALSTRRSDLWLGLFWRSRCGKVILLCVLPSSIAVDPSLAAKGDPCSFEVRVRSFGDTNSLYGRYDMESGTGRSRLHYEFAAKLTRSRSDSIDPNPRPKGWLPLHAFQPPTIVNDYHVQPIGNPSQVNGDARCTRVTMDVGQGFLNNTKERPLHVERQLVDVRARSKLDGEL